MRRLDRYIFAEILGPLALGFLLYTFILLLRVLFRSAELIISSDVEASTVGQLLLLSLPNIVVLTIPMSFLFAILIAVGRLSSDSELVAIRSCGISLFSLYRPILLLSAMLTGLNVYLMLDVLPEGNHALQRLRLDIVTQGLSQEVQPRIPHTAWADRVLYIFEAPPGERLWKGVFLADAIPSGGASRVDVAEWGEARAAPDGSEVVLSLTDAVTHQVDLKAPERYDAAAHSDLDLVLENTFDQRAANVSIKRGLRELPLDELRRTAGDPETSDLVRRMAEVEIHKKFAIPFACMVFGLLALPLGFSNARGGRSSGFAISIGVILVYYILLNWGEDLAKKGSAPAWLMIWLPNVLLLVLGAVLLTRRNRDKSLVLSRFNQWVQEHVWRQVLKHQERRERRREASRNQNNGRRRAGGANLVLRLPQFYLRFPNLVDRYVLTTFFRVFGISTLAGVAVYIAADLTENADEILKHDVPTSVVIDYYKYSALSIFYQISPIIVLVSTLVSFGLLSRTNEITACKALGTSLYRISIPVVLAAMLVAGTCGLLQREVLAASNERVNELENKIRGRDSPTRLLRADRRWLYGKQGGYLYNYGHFDPEQEEIQRLQVFKFDQRYRLTDRLVAERAQYLDGGVWQLTDGWTRSFDGPKVLEFETFDEIRQSLPESPEFFRGVLRLPEEMHYDELRQYIADLKAFGGRDTAPLEVEMHNKIAYPVLSLVMALVALPFAFRLERQGGALYGIGLSLVLGIVLLMFLAFFSAMGGAAILPPMVAVWSPGLIFTIFALYLFLGVRT